VEKQSVEQGVQHLSTGDTSGGFVLVDARNRSATLSFEESAVKDAK
jgi:hypothetical protein